MEWLIGVFVALFAFLFFGALISISTGDDDAGTLGGCVVALAVYMAFGLAVETPFVDEHYLLKVENGKVVESHRRMLLAWDAPDYSTGVHKFNGAYFMSEGIKVSYTIYYRIADENLREMQKYYDGVVIKHNNNLSALLRDLELAIQKKMPATSPEIKSSAEEFMKPYGIKVVGVE